MMRLRHVVEVSVLAALFCFVALLSAGCAANKEKKSDLPSQTLSRVAEPEAGEPSPDPVPEPPVTSEPADAEAPERDRSDLTIVIDPGDETSGQRSLVEAAEAERERRGETTPARIIITDENLKEKATGVLTVAAPENVLSVSASEDYPKSDADGPPPPGDPGAEDYWRSRILQARLAWREATVEIERLQGTVNRLRRRFYEEDDGYYRDSQIKPAWDRALDRLEDAREAAQTGAEEIDQILEEGRQGGALPGWLREGIDLEPEREERRPGDLEEAEVGEPIIYHPEDDGGPN